MLWYVFALGFHPPQMSKVAAGYSQCWGLKPDPHTGASSHILTQGCVFVTPMGPTAFQLVWLGIVCILTRVQHILNPLGDSIETLGIEELRLACKTKQNKQTKSWARSEQINRLSVSIIGLIVTCMICFKM